MMSNNLGYDVSGITYTKFGEVVLKLLLVTTWIYCAS